MVTIITNSTAHNSRNSDLVDGKALISEIYSIIGENFILGSNSLVSSTSLQVGWRSNGLCDNLGAFSIAPKINIKTDDPALSKNTTVLGFKDRDEFPVNFKITVKLAGNTIITENVTGNSSYAYVLNYPKQFVDEIEIEIYKWSKPNKAAKLTEFYFAEYVEVSSIAYNATKNGLADEILRQTEPYGSLDGNFILGHSKVTPSSLDTQIGWRSSHISNATGHFTENPNVNVKILIPQLVQNLVLRGFRDLEEYPEDFKITLFLEGSEVNSSVVSGNNDYEYILKFAKQYVDEMHLEIYKWNKPYKSAKLLEFYLAEYITIDETIDSTSTAEMTYEATYSETASPSSSSTVIADLRRTSNVILEITSESMAVCNAVKKLVVTTNGDAYNSRRLDLTNRLAETEFDYPFLDGNFILGTHKLMPSLADKTKEIGWRSSHISDTTGHFAENPLLHMVLEMPTLLRGVYIVGDIYKDEYPVEFKFTVISEKNIIYEATITDNIYSDYTYEFDEIIVDEIILEIIKWNKPYKAAKLSEFYIPLWSTVVLTSSEGYNTDKYDLVDSIEVQDANLNSLDGNFILGTHKLINSNLSQQVGWRSANVSNEFSIFEVPPTVRVKFDKMHKIQGAYIVGDILKDEYPVNFKCTARRSGLTVAETTITGNTNVKFVFEFLEQNITEVEIMIYKWNKPYKSAKLLEFYIPTYTTLTARVEINNSVDMNYKAEYFENAQIVTKNTVNSSGFVTKLTSAETMSLSFAIADVYNVRARTIDFDNILSQTYAIAKLSIIKSMSYATSITADKYRKKNNPVNSAGISNYVTVNTSQLTVSEEKELYSSEIELDGNKEIIINFDSGYVPVKEANVMITTYNEETLPLYTTIESAMIYPSVAFIKLINTSFEKIKLKIVGTHLELKSSEQINVKSDSSIRENGKITYTLEDNHLIQTREVADKIANLILSSSKDPRREVSVDWRGNPAIELGDEITVTDFEKTDSFTTSFIVTKQELIYDGALKALITGRKKI